MASSSFPLPDAAPPGNVFPSPSRSPLPACGLSPVKEASTPNPTGDLTALKPDTKPTIVEVTEIKVEPDLATPQPSDFPHPPSGSKPSQGNSPDPRPSTPKRRGPPQLKIHTAATRESPTRSDASSPTLVRNNSDASQEIEQTPVMRSMFPRFDSSVPLPQQQYKRPPEPVPVNIPPPPSGIPPANNSPSIYSQIQSPPTNQSRWLTPGASVSNGSSPLRVAEETSTKLSIGEELLDLWSVANGQSSNEAKEVYLLGLHCESLGLNQEAIHFVSASSAVYSLHSSGGTVVLTRTHPLNPETEITICRPTLEQPTVISPLLATIFPCLAELMAVDTASNIAITHRLSRVDSRALQNEAISRAHANEAAQLLWDSDSSAYYLAHPSLTTSTDTVPATLPIQTSPKSITLFSPTSEPVLALNITARTLKIHVPAIQLLSPSLYTLDTLISTVLTLLLHLHRKTSLLGSRSHTPQPISLPHFDPPPPSGSNGVSFPARSRTKSTSTQGKLSRWLSTRSEKPHSSHAVDHGSMALVPIRQTPRSPAFSARTTPHLMASPFDKDIESGLGSPVPKLSTPIPPISRSGVAPELSKETTGVDLSRFQAFDLSDPDLGRGTKVCLRVLYWGFGVLVWCLGVGVGVLASLIVATGGIVGSKKNGSTGKKESLKNSNKKGLGLGRVG